MSEMRFDNREIDAKIANQSKDLKQYIDNALEPLITQVTYTNGRLRKMERNLLIVSCVLGTVVFLKYPEVVKMVQMFL